MGRVVVFDFGIRRYHKIENKFLRGMSVSGVLSYVGEHWCRRGWDRQRLRHGMGSIRMLMMN